MDNIQQKNEFVVEEKSLMRSKIITIFTFFLIIILAIGIIVLYLLNATQLETIKRQEKEIQDLNQKIFELETFIKDGGKKQITSEINISYKVNEGEGEFFEQSRTLMDNWNVNMTELEKKSIIRTNRIPKPNQDPNNIKLNTIAQIYTTDFMFEIYPIELEIDCDNCTRSERKTTINNEVFDQTNTIFANNETAYIYVIGKKNTGRHFSVVLDKFSEKNFETMLELLETIDFNLDT